MSDANRAQVEHWNSPEESGHWVTEQARYEGMLAPFTEMLIASAELGPGDAVLDVGCGCGPTTIAAARVVQPGAAHGVDLSAAMLARARVDAKAAGVGNTSFEQADAQVYGFAEASFDAVISRFGVMFFSDPAAAFANLRGATRGGGRLAFVCWQSLLANEWLLVAGAALAEVVPPPDAPPTTGPGMFAFADPEHPRQLLSGSGWKEVTITPIETSILVGGYGTVDDAVGFLRNGPMGRSLLADVSPDTERRALEAVRGALLPHVTGDGVRLGAAVWLVTARAGD